MSATLQNSRSNRNRNRQPHMTNRGAYSGSNNYRRETPEPEHSNSPPLTGLYADSRSAIVMCSIMGTHTTVKTRNGSVYKGHTTGFSNKGDIALTDAKLENDENALDSKVSGIVIPKDKFVVCKTKGVDLKGLCSAASDFTDSGIVGRINGSSESQLKELQPWQDDDALDMLPTMSLEDPTGGWEPSAMFQVNTDKFNVKSTYNEAMHEYTTKLPDPGSEDYEEKQKRAQSLADEIEGSESYQNRIAKELTDGDEEARYSAVHRAGEKTAESHPSQRQHDQGNPPGSKTYTIPAFRGEGEIRNGNAPRGQGRGAQRQNSPYSSASHPQHPHHPGGQHTHNRQMNNHYQGPPPSSTGPLNRNQGLPPNHQRQPLNNHSGPPHPHSYQQQPPPHPMQHHPTQQQQRPPHPLVSQGPHQKAHIHAGVPSSLPSSHLSQQPPTAQHQKTSPPHMQPPSQQAPGVKNPATNVNGPVQGPPPVASQYRQQSNMAMQMNGDGLNRAEAASQKMSQMDSQTYQQPPSSAPSSTPSSTPVQQKAADSQLSASSSSSSIVDSQLQSGPPAASSQAAMQAGDTRSGRGMETSPDAQRNKIGKSLHEFKNNFNLNSSDASLQEPSRQEETTEVTSSVSSTTPVSVSSSATSTPVTSAPETAVAPVSDPASSKTAEKTDEAQSSTVKSNLNPNAKEFKPQMKQVSPVENQSPSPQPRTPSHLQQIQMYPQQQMYFLNTPMVQPTGIIMPNPQPKKRATVSLGAGVVGDLAAHQVTGQPLLAHHQHSMVLMPNAQAAMPAGYQFPQMINTRIAPTSLTMAQTGQHAGLDQNSAQAQQPQPVFMTTPSQHQHQQILQPIPAHLTHHSQPAHGQPLPHPSSNQQAQPVHVPNASPSPVQHQQHTTQPLPQHLPHHTQGPPQSATPQPAHFPQMSMSFSHPMPAAPRTSMSAQQNMATGGHPAVSIGYPLTPYTSYANPTFAPAAQPQTSQNSSHGPGAPQPQYVVMPQPNQQAHTPMQQHTAQPYTAGLPFQQPNIMQGPPQIPPSHAPQHNQGGHQLIHPGMATGLHQQGTQQGMFVQVPSTAIPTQYQHQQ